MITCLSFTDFQAFKIDNHHLFMHGIHIRGSPADGSIMYHRSYTYNKASMPDDLGIV